MSENEFWAFWEEDFPFKLEGRGEVWSLAGARCCSQVGDRDDTPHQGAMGMERRDNVASDTGDGTS